MNVEQFLSKPYHPMDLLDRIDAEMSAGPRRELAGLVPQSRVSNWRAARGHSEFAPAHTLVKSPILD
jgi:hypothetical protein